MSLLTYYFLQKFVNLEQFSVDNVKLATFVRVIEHGYDESNSYHNRYASEWQLARRLS